MPTAKTPANLSHQVNQLRNIAQFIADKLESMILTGEIEPGTRLVQTEVADSFGVSRLPVRDALAILVKKDLVVNLPRKGVMVRSFTEKEIDNLFDLRVLLESYAVQRSLPKLGPKGLKEARRLLRQQEKIPADRFIELLEIDESFHRHLWSACENEELSEHLSLIWRRIKVIRAYARNVEGWKERSLRSHRSMVEALERDDIEAAVATIQDAFGRSRDELKKSLRQRQSDHAAPSSS